MSTVLSGGAACAALPGGVSGASFRCVTSTGTVGGVSRRVQARVMLGASGGLGGGLIGTSSVLLNNSINAYSCGAEPPRVGSNASVQFVNSNTLHPTPGGCSGAAWAVEYPAGTATSYGNSFSPNPMPHVVRSTPWTIPAVDFAPSQSVNANGSLGGTGWNSATRELNVPNSTTRTLSPGTYNFCSLTSPTAGPSAFQ